MTVHIELSDKWRCWMCGKHTQCALAVSETGAPRLALCTTCHGKLGTGIAKLTEEAACSSTAPES